MGISNFKKLETGPAYVNVTTQTTSRLFTTADAGDLIVVDSSSTVTLTLAQESAQPMDIGNTITVVQKGSGRVDITPSAGVTILQPPSIIVTASTSPNKISTRSQYGRIQLVKIASDTWLADGYNFYVQSTTPANPNIGDIWLW